MATLSAKTQLSFYQIVSQGPLGQKTIYGEFIEPSIPGVAIVISNKEQEMYHTKVNDWVIGQKETLILEN